MHPADRPRFQEEIEKNSFVKDYEIKCRKKDGTEMHCLITSSVEFGDDGGVVGYRGIIRDVTHRKRAEQALRDSEAKYRDLFENSSDVIYTHDLEGNYTSVNDALSKILGYTKEEFLKLNFRDIVDPNYLPKTEDRFRRKLVNGLDKTPPYEIVVRSKEGKPFWFEVSSRLIRKDGKPVGVHGNGRDITKRKAAQEALMESERRMRLVIEESPIGIAIVKDGLRVYANPALAGICGYQSRDDMVGQPVTHVYEPESGELISKWHEDVLQGSAPASLDLKARNVKGEQIDLMVWPRRIDYLGEPAILSFVADTTREKNLTSQLLQAQKMEAIGNLAGGVAHDFNNLLQVIQGYCELLLHSEDMTERAKSRLEGIHHAARSGADLVQRLLAFSRKTEIKPRPVDLNHEVDQNKSLLERMIPKTISLDLYLADDLAAVNADPTEIGQVLMNLAVNANDAMPDGGKLSIQTKNVTLDKEYSWMHLESKPGDYVMLSVSDTGHGMDQETLQHIFEPFFTTKETGKGTGLGLATVYGIVKQHGGYINCYSEPGEGTTFKIYLPVIRSEVKYETAVEKPIPPSGTETILLVDDQEIIRELGKRGFWKEFGYTVLTAENGKEALDLYTTKMDEISLVILDLIMPEMGGRQCLEELLKIDSRARVLIASGFAENGQTKEAIETGARGFVGKPYEMSRMLQAIREVSGLRITVQEDRLEVVSPLFFHVFQIALGMFSAKQQDYYSLFGNGLFNDKFTEIL